MNTPQRPQEPPTHGAPSDANPEGDTPHGIPDGMDEHEPKGRPTSDREQTEAAPGAIEKS